ncbi:hypothetical protein BV20DRAFT_84350 [Pilatotrama ljubarskyi]|nr:hypothetical protein BV20DRAFT_84350 [Pilatotrama ljubarskyi]
MHCFTIELWGMRIWTESGTDRRSHDKWYENESLYRQANDSYAGYYNATPARATRGVQQRVGSAPCQEQARNFAERPPDAECGELLRAGARLRRRMCSKSDVFTVRRYMARDEREPEHRGRIWRPGGGKALVRRERECIVTRKVRQSELGSQA